MFFTTSNKLGTPLIILKGFNSSNWIMLKINLSLSVDSDNNVDFIHYQLKRTLCMFVTGKIQTLWQQKRNHWAFSMFPGTSGICITALHFYYCNNSMSTLLADTPLHTFRCIKQRPAAVFFNNTIIYLKLL